MLEKLQKVEDKFGEIESQLGDPAVISDVVRFKKLQLLTAINFCG